MLKDFPRDLLTPRHAVVSGVPGNVSLEVLLRPFFWDGNLVDTSIRLDHIDLPSAALGPLVGRTFTFVSNPDEGAIDGSLYLAGRHHPVDVTRLAFHRSRDDEASVVIQGVYIFEFEGLDGHGNMPFTLCARRVSSCAL